VLIPSELNEIPDLLPVFIFFTELCCVYFEFLIQVSLV
jgi:hypothetical protein